MKIQVTIQLLNEMLGTSNANKKIHEQFIASKAEDAPKIEEEIAALGVEEVVENAMTIFPREDGKPFIWDYQIRGFFKEACSMLQRAKGFNGAKASSKIKAYKKVIDGTIFVEPRKIPIDMKGGEIGNCQRPLRGQTAQGERIALANSETVPAGSEITFTVNTLNKEYFAAVIEWLAYGKNHGLLQWRNSGKGTFKVLDIQKVDDGEDEVARLMKMIG